MRRFLALALCVGLIAGPAFAQSTGGGGGGGTGANPTGTVGLAVVNGSATTFLRSDGAPPLSQSIAPTWTAEHIFNAAGVASTPSVLFNGTVFTGGTGTTTVPNVYCNYGTAPTTWSTSGTLWGCNAPSAFAGNLLDFHLNGGSSLFKVDQNGNSTVAGSAAAQGAVQWASSGGTASFSNGNGPIASSGLPTPGGTGFGTGPTIAGSSTLAFVVTVGTTPSAATFTLTSFPPTAQTGWTCGAQDITTFSGAGVFMFHQTASSTTSITGEFVTDAGAVVAPTASDKIWFRCGAG